MGNNTDTLFDAVAHSRRFRCVRLALLMRARMTALAMFLEDA